ncbi:impB/mucB/samB family protein [Diaporthe helianthi]|uniref:DNA polymerase kappa n=1 Tax=Diaporthe helianthi TaxID=158607 RepID=A0A2P5HRV4_DIAHE|nr:impB/mucB/samB family protein [Diaporthe helianthi]
MDQHNRPPLSTTDAVTSSPQPGGTDDAQDSQAQASQHATLKYSLLGPSLTKAGQGSVDQRKVSDIIYNVSKGTRYFNREEERDKILTLKIERILEKKRKLDKLDLSRELRKADTLIAELENSRDLTQSIVHVDCDAFYAAVEELDRPELKGLPFAVGVGVLTTCNYVARQFGCRSGMAGFVAKRLCPDLICLPVNFDKYTAKANEVREVIAEYDPRFESASIDEAYLNITEYCRDHNMSPEDAVDQLRRQVHLKTSITVSAGIAANAKLAKICSNINKPNGQFVLPNDRVSIIEFMRDLPCRKVNGIGRVWERELKAIGIETCGNIYGQRQFLDPLFGEKAFEFLMTCHLGLGRTDIQPADEYERKSVGTESTFHDISDPKQLREKLLWTAQELEKDMRRAKCKGRTLVLKIKLHTYEVVTRQTVLPRAINLSEDLFTYAVPILAKLEQDMPGMKIRLMGLRCTHLVSTKKPDTRAFFGLEPRRDTSNEPGKVLRVNTRVNDDQIRGMVSDESHAQDDMRGPSGKDGEEVVPNATLPNKITPAPVEWWECPICSRPQPADERQFNSHIDGCLSRQTIRDAVQQEQQATSSQSLAHESKWPRTGSEKKRGRQGLGQDPKQKKLCFG